MNEFEKLVFEMRKAQREYFKTKQNYWLVRSKDFEKQVDQYISNIINPGLF